MKVEVDLRDWQPSEAQLECMRRLRACRADWNDRALVDYAAEGELWGKDLICECPYHGLMRLTELGGALLAQAEAAKSA